MAVTISRKLYRYIDAVVPYINQIIEDIAKSPDGKARYLISDIRKNLGTQFEKMPDINVYLIMKYVLNIVGIDVDRGYHKEGYELLIMSKMTESYINQIIEDVTKSPDGKVTYKIDDIRKIFQFEETDINIYLITKSVLYTVGIDVEKGLHKEGYGLLIMSKIDR